MSRSRRRPAKKQQADRAAARKFWGEIPTDEAPTVHMTDDAAAMVLSLGEPPLRNNERAAQATFTLVYRKAAQLAYGLGVAAGLDEEPTEG
jgi:hypothetical protein